MLAPTGNECYRLATHAIRDRYCVIRSWDDFKYYVRADMRSCGTRLSLRTFLMNPLVRFTALMRLDEYLLNLRRPFLVRLPIRIWLRSLSIRLGFSMGPNIFGPGLAIVHYGTIVIDPTTRIGKNCRIHVGVHIGGSAQFVDEGDVANHSPRIGDNVYLAPGAKLYGPITIGNNAVIGANAVVNRSFPEPGLVIAGIPARVIGEGSDGERVLKGADRPFIE